MQYWKSLDEVRENYDVGNKSLNGYEHNLLFRNDGAGFIDIAYVSGCDSVQDGRGVAAGDIDDDGDVDLVVTSLRQPLICYENAGSEGHSLQVRLVGSAPNAPAIGAVIIVEAGGRRQVREVRGGSGFLSQSALWQTFGLGDADLVDTVTVYWPALRDPNGNVTRASSFIHSVGADSILTVDQVRGTFDVRPGIGPGPRPIPSSSSETPTGRRAPR